MSQSEPPKPKKRKKPFTLTQQKQAEQLMRPIHLADNFGRLVAEKLKNFLDEEQETMMHDILGLFIRKRQFHLHSVSRASGSPASHASSTPEHTQEGWSNYAYTPSSSVAANYLSNFNA